jgi:hypothetical protein
LQAPIRLGVRAAQLFVQLRHMFPEAHAIAYVPPVSAWIIAQIGFDGGLDSYVEALRRTASAYDEFVDFGLPSATTIDPANTYDGSHYSEAVNRQVAAALSQGTAGFGSRWGARDDAEIAAEYRTRLRHYGLLAAPDDASDRAAGAMTGVVQSTGLTTAH